MVSTIHHNRCLCCGSTAVSGVMQCIDNTVSKQSFEVWQCSTCTFRFTQNAPDEQNIGPYYQSSAYVSHSDTTEGFINRLYHVVRKFTLVTKAELVKKVTGVSKGSLLDFGAGTGAFLNAMQKKGWQVAGVEPDESARAMALKKNGLNLQTPNALPAGPGIFDAITLWHVLEHVHHLRTALQDFHRLLKPHGRLLIAVPNYKSFDAAYYKQHWASWDVPRHLYHFSPESFEVLIASEGFRLKTIKPMWFDSFYVSMLSEQYKTGQNNYVRAIAVGLLSNLKAMFNKSKCSSIIYVLEKA